DLRLVDRFDVGAGATKVGLILPRAPRDYPCERAAIGAESRVRELRLATAGDQLLHHNDVGRDQPARLVIAREERLAVLDPPGFGAREAILLLFCGRFENSGKRAVERRNLIPAPWIARPWKIEPDLY